jgi:hypothetical protein
MVKTVKLKRGEGSIVQLKQRDPNSGERRDSKLWSILYCAGTRQVRENTKTNDYSKAYNMLIERRDRCRRAQARRFRYPTLSVRRHLRQLH